MDKLLNSILSAYRINPIHIDPVQKGYRNSSFFITLKDNTKLNLIIYKREPGILDKIKASHLIANILKEHLPVRYPIKPILRIKEDWYACVYNYLEGSTIAWDSYTAKHLKLLGANLSKIHGYSRIDVSEVAQSFSLEAENLKDITRRVQNYFYNESVLQALNNKLRFKINFIKFLEHISSKLPEIDSLNSPTVLHMDFVRGNILYNNSTPLEITGIIDFEKASVGSFIFDVARTLAFLLVDCKYKSEKEVRKSFLKSGYIKSGVYKPKSFKYLNEITLTYLIYDFYKFLKHNPYEFLSSNEHFLKTCEILLKTNLILSSSTTHDSLPSTNGKLQAP